MRTELSVPKKSDSMVRGTEENKEYSLKYKKTLMRSMKGMTLMLCWQSLCHGLQGRKVDHVRQEYDQDISLISNC